MNTELLEPALTELLQVGRELKTEQVEQRKLLVKLLERRPDVVEAQALKELFKAEIEQLKMEQRESSAQQRSRSWTLFSNDFQAQNFKVVMDTVFKWVAIICGSLYLIKSIVLLFKSDPPV